MTRNDKTQGNGEQTLVMHLVELRNRLLRILLYIAIVFLVLLPFSNDLYTLLAAPLISRLPAGATMIATEVASPLLIPFKFSLILAFFLTTPLILHQLWAFIAPGLYQKERSIVVPLLVSTVVLFFAGIAFAYYVVLPLMFGFFIGIAPEGVAIMTDIGRYLDFVLKMFFAFGMAFEVPVATLLLVKAGVTSPADLAAKRPYIIVGAFVFGMLFTPPDIISQTLLALPVWLLFELGLFLSRLIQQKDADTLSSEESD